MAESKSKQRIKFGKNGIKDGNGKIIRTDHSTMRDVINDIIDGSGMSREDVLNKRVQDAVDGVSSIKRKQDKLAGITRRKA